ncbi:hypothetical protein [Pyruvatibacter sp.]
MSQLKRNRELFAVAVSEYFGELLKNQPSIYVHPLFVGSFAANQSALDERQVLGFFAASSLSRKIDTESDWDTLPVSVFEYLLDNPGASLFEVKAGLGNYSGDLSVKARLFSDRFFPERKLPEDLSVLLNAGDCEFFFGPNENSMANETEPSARNSDPAAAGPTTQVPAADRYVRSSDNQPEFDTLLDALNRAVSEFGKDHNKGEVTNDPAGAAFISEVKASLAQIQSGMVRIGQLTDGLRPATAKLSASAILMAAYPGLKDIVADILHALTSILTLFGVL